MINKEKIRNETEYETIPPMILLYIVQFILEHDLPGQNVYGE